MADGALIRALLTFLLFCSFAKSHARVDVLVATPGSKSSALKCADYFVIHANDWLDQEEEDLGNHVDRVHVSRREIRDYYRELEIASDDELDHMENEDDLFPARSVIYLRSVSDFDGSLQGIIRLVSNYDGRFFFNIPFSLRNRDEKPKLPIFYRYKRKKFRRFFTRRFRRAIEIGKLAYGKNLNLITRHRVLIDLLTAASDLIYFTEKTGRQLTGAEIVIESLPKPTYTSLGFVEEPGNYRLNGERRLLQMTAESFHRRFKGNVYAARNLHSKTRHDDDAGMEKVGALHDLAITEVSSNPAVRRLYIYGLVQRALFHYDRDEFSKMRDDMREVVRHKDGKDIRLVELFAEVGSRFNWVTRKGDADEALRYLRAEPQVQRFADANLPERVKPGMLIFLQGLIYLHTGRVAEARQIREQVTALDYATADFRRARPDFYGRILEEDLTGRFNPETGEGRPYRAADHMRSLMQENPWALSYELWNYYARFLAATGQSEAAAHARTIADQLR